MSGSLDVVSGVVSNLSIYAGEEEFIRSAEQQAAGVGVAAGLAASGLAGVAAGTSLAVASGGDSVEFFSCSVGEVSVKGCFSKVSFKDGDELTAVVAQSTRRAWAVRRKHDCVLWMSPHCSRGTKAHARFAWRMFPWIFLSLFALLGSFFAVMDWRSSRPFDPEATIFWVSLHFVMTLVVAAYYPIRFYRQWLPIAREAERIFAALGYADPSRVDLPRDHKRYCKMHGIKWPYLTDGPWIYHYIA